MIRTIISDIGNVLSGFTWYDFYKSKGYSEEMVERLAKATVGVISGKNMTAASFPKRKF